MLIFLIFRRWKMEIIDIYLHRLTKYTLLVLYILEIYILQVQGEFFKSG